MAILVALVGAVALMCAGAWWLQAWSRQRRTTRRHAIWARVAPDLPPGSRLSATDDDGQVILRIGPEEGPGGR